MNKKTLLFLAPFCLAGLTFFIWKTLPRPASSAGTASGDIGKDLPARVAALPKPALTNLPQLTPAVTSTGATSVPATKPAPLSEEVLAPLRRAFVPPRFTEDRRLPRERQTLLSNRLLVSPEKRDIPKAASGQQLPTPRNTTPFIVQFNTPVSDAARKRLTDAGALVRGFFPNNAVLAELTPATLNALNGLATVQAASEFLPTDKLQPFLLSLVASQAAETRIRATIQTLAPEDAEPVAAAVRAVGGEVEDAKAGTRWGIVQAILPLASVKTLAKRGEVQWLEERPLIQKRNDKAAIPSHLNTTNVWDTWGLTGKGQIVGHADTGLDTGALSTMHPDFQGRILAAIGLTREGDASDLNGHGTHTAGSIIGNGAASGGQFKGMAWEAELVHQSVEDAAGDFTGLPAELYDLYLQTYAYGAHIHSDSWGGDAYGAYTIHSRSTDLFAWDHPDHLAVFSCGNAGRDTNRDGVVDLGSVGSPATAKNVLTVGAAESDRPTGSGGYSSYSWGSLWPSWFPAAPIKTDFASYSATTSPYRQGMAAFSSRGPTDDNRIKPDVIAPGTDIISTRSSVNGSSAMWGAYAANSRYCFCGGTSMSAPLIAGTALLMRQYAVERAGITNPSAALIKAMLVGGARSLTPGQYGTNAYQEIPNTSPNNVEGWGQPDIGNTVHPAGRMVRLYDRIGPDAGATNTFEITVTASNAPLDVALVWIDYPATAGATITLVNDLDLLVIAPDGTPLYPNSGTSRDTVNTVETLRLNAAQPGRYQIHVIGAAVPYSGGAAALYVRGAFDAAPVCVHTPLTAQRAGIIPYPVDFQIQSLLPLTNGESRLFWTLGTADGPTSSWHSVAASWVTNTLYRAEIPPQPPCTYVHYYLQVDDGTYRITLPNTAPAATFSFYVDLTAELVVDGTPARYGTVTPPYGTNIQIVSFPFEISAPPIVTVATGVRRVCMGWSGTGDVPPQGSSNTATLAIRQASSLTWRWGAEYTLTSRYRLANTGQTFGQTVTWYPDGASAATESALELGFVGSTPYAFCGWYVDDARWPNATVTSPNPATGIIISAPRTARGDYLPFWQDTDGNGLSDWWETRYFGTATNANASATDDLDGDFWTNLAEFLDNTDPNDAASVPTPPDIVVTPLDAGQTNRPPWTVQAAVTDNLTVEVVTLFWREEGDTAWQSNAMSRVAGDTYTAPLNPPSHGAKRIDYFVFAGDLIGYYFPEYGSVSPTYSVIGDYPAPWLDVTPEGFNLFELSENATNIALNVANLAGPDLIWTARVATATGPFAATNSAWAHSGLNDAWCVTTNRTWNGDAVWYCGDPSMRSYDNGCHAMLDTPPFTVGEGGGLLFRQWIKTEYDTDTHYWDGAVIRVSTDGGATFTRVEPTGGYPYLITENPDSPFDPDQPCLAGTGTGWQTVMLDLSAYAGQNVIVRFEFGSDLYVTDEGWYVANVTPFSCESALPPWVIPVGPWGGMLPSTGSAALAMTLDPTTVSFNDEVLVCLRIDSNDPTAHPLIPLTMRRGHRLILSSNGPGTATADNTFLFREATATATLRAKSGCYLYSVLLNNIPQPGVYDYGTVYKTFLFKNVTDDQTLVAWFTPCLWNLTVASAFGNATPAVGSYALTNGTIVEASVTAPLDVAQGVRQQCTGWGLTGHKPSAGTLHHLSFPITNNATLSWNWNYEFQLTAATAGNGAIAPTGGWYSASASASVTSYPSAYYHTDAWLGDTENATYKSNLISFVMYMPRTVTATFAPNLTAARGVPEAWLAAYGWNQDFEAAAEADADHDGMAAWAEWRADTDPTNALSLLALTALSSVSNRLTLTWCGGMLRTQQIQQALTPAGPWIAVYTNLPPTPVTNTCAVPANGGSGFFRIHIE